MFQITADLTALNSAQRNAVAAFISTFPSAEDAAEDLPATFSDGFQIPEEAFDLATGPMLVDPQPAPVPAPPVTGTELDAAGLPWDERIHASSRAKVTDGTWRKKRGVDAAVTAPVEAQLKAVMAVPAPVEEIHVVPPPPVVAAPVVAPLVVAPPVAPVAAAPVGIQVYVDLMTKASQHIQAGKLTQDELNGLVLAAGVPTLQLLANRMDLVPSVIDSLNALVASRQ